MKKNQCAPGVLVTPTMAAKTLSDSKIRNRRINPMRVKYFVGLMKSGQFMCTHQGIALDDENNIVDGQHRLAAIAESKCSVYIMVSKGVPLDTMPVVDCGASRSLSHRLALVGRVDSTTAHIAIARILEYGILKSSQASLGFEDAVHILDKYQDGLKFTIDVAKGKKLPAPISAVIARAYYTKDEEKLKRFVEVYTSECPDNPGESAPLRLKRKVVEMGKFKVHDAATRVAIYNLAESAIVRFLKGEVVSVLIPSEKENFELPKF